MIKIVKGDIIKAFQNGKIQYIGHQVNCVGGWDAGLHRKLAKIYSHLIEVAKTTKFQNSYFGCAHKAIDENNQYIYNLYSQYYISKPNSNFIPNSGIKDDFPTRLKALKSSLTQMCDEIVQRHENSETPIKIGLPLLASGLARQNGYSGLTDLEYFTEHIYSTVEDVFKNYPILDVTIYHL